MAVNNLTRFRKDDYPEAQSWWTRAIGNINLIVDYVLNLNIQLTQLIARLDALPVFETRTIDFMSAATSTTNPEANIYSFKMDSEPSQLMLRATNSSFPTFTSPVWASWYYTNGTVFITAITGLANSTVYQLTITTF